jgi:predicted DNA-binding transcriptional regulator AlpA
MSIDTANPAVNPRRKRRRPRLAPLLVDYPTAARLLSISTASLYRRESAGQVGPKPLQLGGRRLFRVDELRRWVAADLPDRAAWIELEQARKHNGRE